MASPDSWHLRDPEIADVDLPERRIALDLLQAVCQQGKIGFPALQNSDPLLKVFPDITGKMVGTDVGDPADRNSPALVLYSFQQPEHLHRIVRAVVVFGIAARLDGSLLLIITDHLPGKIQQ